MGKKILWLDDEPALISAKTQVLRSAGFDLKGVRTLTEARNCLEAELFDLLILDVIVPAQSDAEEEDFPPIKTDLGLSAGLYFYEHMKPRLEEPGTKVLVFTVRLESEIRTAFYDLGLEEINFATKLELRDVHDFLSRVRQLLGEETT